eukprot:9518948-Alexandrium_andersonii.AAC.1
MCTDATTVTSSSCGNAPGKNKNKHRQCRPSRATVLALICGKSRVIPSNTAGSADRSGARVAVQGLQLGSLLRLRVARRC